MSNDLTRAHCICSVGEAYGDIFDEKKFRVAIEYDGTVVFAGAGKSITTCLLDVSYFPFDSQACYIELNRYHQSSSATTATVHFKVSLVTLYEA